MMIFLLHISHDILSEKWPIIQKMLKFPKITRKSPDPKNANGMRATKNSLRHERLSFRTSLESYFRTMAELSFVFGWPMSGAPYYRFILIVIDIFRYIFRYIFTYIYKDNFIHIYIFFDFHGLSLIFYVLYSIGPLIWPFCLPLAPVMKPWRPCTSQKVRQEIPSLHFTLDLNLTSP